MEQKQEYWDLFRESDGSFYRRMKRGEFLIPPGLYHQSVEIIATDGKGYLLLTKRSFAKRFGAGQMEFPAGSVISGEVPMKAAIRELNEETGLMVTKVQKVGEFRVPGIKKFLYLAMIPDLRQRTIRLQQGETIGYEFVTYDEWLKMVIHGQFASNRAQFYTPGFYDIVKQKVGVPTDLPPTGAGSDVISIRPVTQMLGRHEGISGKAVYEEDGEAEKIFNDMRESDEAEARFFRRLNAASESEEDFDEYDQTSTPDPSA